MHCIDPGFIISGIRHTYFTWGAVIARGYSTQHPEIIIYTYIHYREDQLYIRRYTVYIST